VESQRKSPWLATAGRRTIILVSLIAVLVPFWLYLAFYTNLPTIVLGAVALLMLLILALATAWTAIAIPKRGESTANPERGRG